jgi:hypothetical protein
LKTLTSENIKDRLPLILSLLILTTIVSLIFFISKNFTGGKFIYALDDAYIHLAYSKNIALHNVWGVTKYEFSSSTSSPLWTILLTSLFLVFGVNEYIPFILNIFFSFILLYVIYNFLKQQYVSNFFTAVTLITVIVFLPVTIHIFSGMEHLFHSILTILFIKYSARSLCESRIVNNKLNQNDKYLFFISVFITTIRYEAFFLILIVSALFLIRKNFLISFMILLLSLLLPVAFSIIFVKQGEYFFPNSIMLKKSFLSLSNLFNIDSNSINFLIESKKIIFLLTVSVILFFLQLKIKKNFWSEIPLLLFILISVILIQKIVINIAYFRYDAYLVASAITIDSLAIYDYCLKKLNLEINFKTARKYKTASCIFFICLMYFTVRQFYFNKTITAMKNIYEQQYQMAKFIDKFYSGKEVALNDIGAVNFFADLHCIDLIGLGTNEIADERISKKFNSSSLNEIAKNKNVKIGIVYDKWVQEDIRIPNDWIKVGVWKIPDNYICGDDEVSFYAVGRDEKEHLIKNLKSFSGELPVTVLQSGEYLFGK